MYTPTRVLIFGKTYPELSARHVETVCTGGLNELGRPVRLYPVPLRYLEGPQQYNLYEWITVPMEESSSDPRPESYKILPEKIVREAVIKPDKDEWAARRVVVFRDPSWHFGGMAALKAANDENRCSIGLVTPGQVDDVELLTKSATDRAAFEEKRAELQQRADADMFHPDFKDLAFLPHEIRLRGVVRSDATPAARSHTG